MWAAIGECKSGGRRLSSRVSRPQVKSHRSAGLVPPSATINDCIDCCPWLNLQQVYSQTSPAGCSHRPPHSCAHPFQRFDHTISCHCGYFGMSGNARTTFRTSQAITAGLGSFGRRRSSRSGMATERVQPPSPRNRGEGDKGTVARSGRGEFGGRGEREGSVTPAAAPLNCDQRGEAEQRGKYQVIAR